MRRHGPRGTIPKTYRHVPHGYAVGGATFAELKAAGFHGGPEVPTPEPQPEPAPFPELLTEADVSDLPPETLARAVFIVLRDSDGRIVATWAEGRWWTPEEIRRGHGRAIG